MHRDLAYLEQVTARVVEASRVRPGQSVAGSVSALPLTIVKPGGGDCYPALWTRDFCMSVECGYITPREITDTLEHLAGSQCLEDRTLPSGSAVPRGSIPDHVNLDGSAIYYPGTYTPEEQGGAWGHLPSLDDQYWFVFLLWFAVMRRIDPGAASKVVGGVPLLERADLAFAMPPVSEVTGLVTTSRDRWGVAFGFTDSVLHTGGLLMTSLLRCESAGYLAVLHTAAGDHEAARRYATVRDQIRRSLAILRDPVTGLLRAATGTSRQADLWGTAYALCRGLLPAEMADDTRRALIRALNAEGTVWQGQIRHVPVSADYDATRVWEAQLMPVAKGRYQHGAYWATPLGWVLDAVSPVEAPLARSLLGAYVDHLRREESRGAPWECVHPDGDYRQNALYMTSVAAVLPAARRLAG